MRSLVVRADALCVCIFLEENSPPLSVQFDLSIKKMTCSLLALDIICRIKLQTGQKTLYK